MGNDFTYLVNINFENKQETVMYENIEIVLSLKNLLKYF